MPLFLVQGCASRTKDGRTLHRTITERGMEDSAQRNSILLFEEYLHDLPFVSIPPERPA